ncbi:hypothetical protein WN48_05997 [Eufriesea mexicana]|nr:hypothetical protein WN48_05997 [Eufriesea mexicana]
MLQDCTEASGLSGKEIFRIVRATRVLKGGEVESSERIPQEAGGESGEALFRIIS